MNKFAQLFEAEKYGQLLVRLCRDDNGEPAIIMSIDLSSRGMGIMDVTTNFPDEDEAWDKVQEQFNKLTADEAIFMLEALVPMKKVLRDDA